MTLGYPALLVEVSCCRPELDVGNARPPHHGKREDVLVGLAFGFRDGCLQDIACFLSLLPVLGHDDHPFRCPTHPQSTPTYLVWAGIATCRRCCRASGGRSGTSSAQSTKPGALAFRVRVGADSAPKACIERVSHTIVN